MPADRYRNEKDRDRKGLGHITRYGSQDGRKGVASPGALLYNILSRKQVIQARYADSPEQALLEFAAERKFDRVPEPIGNTLTVGDRVFVAREAQPTTRR